MATNDNTASLFSAEELTRVMGGMDFKEDQPVTVLGITFDNDTKRRDYFREELRKKLPELRNIEGFPIGSDEDIINLSDPPYYTACPNPWLNDFIEQWEVEKTELVVEGKRNDEFEVKEPYAIDVTGIKNDSVYRSLFYHTKVPQAIIMKYLCHYTQPGDIVLDGFAGTGMTGLACQSCENPLADVVEKVENFSNKNKGRRHCICGDLSPFATSMAYNLNTPIEISSIKKEINRIMEEMDEEYGWMYKTRHSDGKEAEINCVIFSDIVLCPSCGAEIILWNEAVDKEKGILKDEIVCPHCGIIESTSKLAKSTETVFDNCINETIQQRKSVPVRVVYTRLGKRYEKIADHSDIELIEKIDAMPAPFWFPTNPMMGVGNQWGDTWRAGVHVGITNVHHFYTKRNLIVLSAFYDKIKHSVYSNKLLYLFTGMIVRSTNMNRVHFTKYLAGKTDWDAGHLKGTMYVPSYSVESSVLAQIKNKWQRYEKAAPYLPSKYDNLLTIASASNTGLKDDSIDYIFVDPPFGSNIMYSELNYLAEAWLKVTTNNDQEAIEDNTHNKDLSFYLEIMTSCFAEFFRVLKPGKWMTVEFSNTSASVWNAIQQAITKSGFVIANVSALNKGQGGMRSISSTTAVKQDLAISCYKPTISIINSVTDGNFDIHLWDFIEEYLNHVDPSQIKDSEMVFIQERDIRIIYDKIVSHYVQAGLPVPIDSKKFQEEMNERFVERDGMYFTSIQAFTYEENKKRSNGIQKLALFVSSENEGISWLKNRLYNNSQTYQEISPDWMKSIKAVKKNDIIPELKQLLEENFIEDEGGKWRLPNIQDDKDVAALRTKALLREFKIYVEIAQKPKGKIKEARVEALRTGFKQCYIDKDFQTIVTVGDKIPQNLLTEDEVLLQFYDIAQNKL